MDSVNLIVKCWPNGANGRMKKISTLTEVFDGNRRLNYMPRSHTLSDPLLGDLILT